MRYLELLSPAKTADIGMAAISHGADAVYIGASSHGARHAAANSLEDIQRLVDFAHPFRARVYATVNTLILEHELKDVERLITDLYRIGVDAIIVQDPAILRLDIPPIELHASTQMDTRTPEKARFLQEMGFSQIVTARELTLSELHAICESVSVPVETFVHGALCVSYSGRCHVSQACMGRSANRGKCAQMCRLPYTLCDADGRVISKDKYLLSLKDLNLHSQLQDLVDAGASSFKIEGRLKDEAYVKNVTAAYSRKLEEIVAVNPNELARRSCGRSEINFEPELSKSFNRGFSKHFTVTSRPETKLASIDTPKSLGEIIDDTKSLNNGDGIAWFAKDGSYIGTRVNRVVNGKVELSQQGSGINSVPKGVQLHRTYDNHFTQLLAKPTAVRTLTLDMKIDATGITATDERGVMARVPLGFNIEQARSPRDLKSDLKRTLGKLGDTIYRLRDLKVDLPDDAYLPPSLVADARRRLVDALNDAAAATYKYGYRRDENPDYKYPYDTMDYRDNVANRLAAAFWREHGVINIEPAMESGKRPANPGDVLMTCRYCILRELGKCMRDTGFRPRQPLTITTGPHTLRLNFDCSKCEMQVLR